jgi:hypothetical protein
VDRLEYATDGAPNTRDESLLDTAVDLFVYCLKYQTFLADQDISVAETLFSRSGISGSYSEGPTGFEHLLTRVNLGELDAGSLTAAEAVSCILTRFSELESCFSGDSTQHSATVRLGHVQRLIKATVSLIAVLKHDDGSLYRNFLLSNTGGV